MEIKYSYTSCICRFCPRWRQVHTALADERKERYRKYVANDFPQLSASVETLLTDFRNLEPHFEVDQIQGLKYRLSVLKICLMFNDLRNTTLEEREARDMVGQVIEILKLLRESETVFRWYKTRLGVGAVNFWLQEVGKKTELKAEQIVNEAKEWAGKS